MKRLLTLSAFLIAAVFAVLAYALPSNQFDFSFPLAEPEPLVPGSSQPATALAAPELVPTAGEGQIIITWQPVADANSYELWFRLAANPWEELAAGTLISSTTIYTHTNLLPGDIYTYAGLAVSASGEKGPWSTEVHATVLADIDAPVLIAAPGPARIDLSWQPVTGADSYELWAYENTTNWQRIDTGQLISATTSFTHSDLAPGVIYYYQIRALNADDAPGPWSAQVHNAANAALAPPALTATAGAAQVTLTWQPVTDAAGYEIWTRQSDAAWQQIDDGSLSGTDTSFIHSGLGIGQTYYYTARSVAASGHKGPWGQQTEATPNNGLAAPALTATAGIGFISLSWQPVTGAATYELWAEKDHADRERLDDGALTATSYTHDELTPGTHYHHLVRPLAADGTPGPWSQETESIVEGAFPAPNLTATPGVRQNTLSWDAVTGAAKYELWAWEDGVEWYRLDDGSLTDTTYNHTGLTIGNTYYYSLRALSSDDKEGLWSAHAEATVLGELTTPVLTATASGGQVVITWQPVPGADTYELWVADSVNGWQQLDDGALAATTFTHSSGAAGTTYYYTLRAHASDGKESAWSEHVSATP